MNKLLITGCLLATAFAAVAMPNKKELAAAQKLVEDVIAPDVKALNAGRKTVKDVADIQMKLAADAQSEAEKYLLLQSAFKLYSRGEEFESAAKALTAISRDIKDVPPELVTELVDKEFNRDMGLKAPKEIVAAKRAMQRQRLVATQKEKEKTRKIRPTLGGLRRSDQLGARRLQRQQEAQTATQLQATVDGYTWSYRVSNGEAEIVSQKVGECAVLPKPTGNVTIPAMLGGVKVTRIGKSAFRKCSELTSLVIPDGVTSIGGWAFHGCYRLASVTIPEGVREIGNCAFLDCNALTSVSIPASLTAIHPGAFPYCASLTSFLVSSRNERYVSRDGIVFDRDMKTLVFYPRGRVGMYVIPSGITAISSHAFMSCRRLTSVTLPESVTSIGERAFYDCNKLVSMTIPSNVTSIGTGAFYLCSELKSFVVDSTNLAYSSPNGLLCSKDGRVLIRGVSGNVTIPSGVALIDERAFYDCDGLTQVVIPSSVTSIGKLAFYRCQKLTSVTIPSSVTSIEKDAFFYCSGLMSVTMFGERPETDGNIFGYCKKLTSIHVSANAKSWAGMKEWQGIPLVFDGSEE